jgi:hypothetical protein
MLKPANAGLITARSIMRTIIRSALFALSLLAWHGLVSAAPAIEVLGKDYSFPHKLAGLPAKLSDFQGLQINTFTTTDGVKLLLGGGFRQTLGVHSWLVGQRR